MIIHVQTSKQSNNTSKVLYNGRFVNISTGDAYKYSQG
ncbi:MAG: hypothetical protein JWP81_1063 [Ferruginibacter sp.]|nr:hypothetical protein [Ferruginibacter sp.]